MRPYAKGDQVEVLNRNSRLEDSWHPARIVEVHDGGVYSVVYDGRVNGAVVKATVSVNCIRPRPPFVEFEQWCRGDLVHVFDIFAWKLATVLEVLEKKQFLVRVVGSMRDLKVGIAGIRVRHYWQEDRWIIVGKGPSRSNEQWHNMISDSQVRQRNTSTQASRRSTRQTYHNVPTKAMKRSGPRTLDQTPSRRGLTKISRTAERTSSCTLNWNQNEACTETGTSSRVIEEHRAMSRPLATNANLRESQAEINEYSVSSSVGSCSSVNSNCSRNQYPKKCAEQHCDDDLSDAESCTMPSPKQKNQIAGVFVSEKINLDRPAKGCGTVLRFRLKEPLLPGRVL